MMTRVSFAIFIVIALLAVACAGGTATPISPKETHLPTATLEPTPTATPQPTSGVPSPPPLATEVTWRVTPADGLTGQIAVNLYSLALIDLQGGPPKFLGPPLPTYSQFSWAPDSSKLAYLLLADLWVADVETHQTWNLTDHGWYHAPDRWELMPSWSPDGRYIAFTSRPLEPEEYGQTETTMHGVFGGQVTVIRADGSDYRVLDKEAVAHNPRWAPDSQRLVYTSSDGKLYIIDLESGQRQQLPPTEYGLQEDLYFYGAVWSPKGDEMAISFSTRPKPEDTSVEQGCAILNLRDHSSRTLRRYTARLLMPYEGTPPGETLCCVGPDILWSPSGNYILVNVKPLPRTELATGLFVIDTQGREEKSLTGVYGAYQADWSPDGRWVAYIDLGDGLVYVVDPFNPEERWLYKKPEYAPGHYDAEGLAWRPIKGAP